MSEFYNNQCIPSCYHKETIIINERIGPRGEIGPPGPAGPQGPTGARGQVRRDLPERRQT